MNDLVKSYTVSSSASFMLVQEFSNPFPAPYPAQEQENKGLLDASFLVYSVELFKM